jgi:creatinine amidohydrolase
MFISRLNMSQFKESVREHNMETVVVPIGMLEAHGEHCALGTDMLIPREFMRRLDKLMGTRLLIAPEIPYGHSFSLSPFAGTIDISAQAFGEYVYAVCAGFVRQGCKQIVLFNGHGGNMAALNLVSERLADLGAFVLTINWWIDYKDLIAPIAKATGHAGEDETSCVLAIDASLVDMSKAHSYGRKWPTNIKFAEMGKYVYPNANNGDATQATADKGERIYEALLPAIVQDIEMFWDLKTEVSGA